MKKFTIMSIALVALFALAAPSAEADRRRSSRGVSFSVSPGRVSVSGSYRSSSGTRFSASFNAPRISHRSAPRYHGTTYVSSCTPAPRYYTYRSSRPVYSAPRPVTYTNYTPRYNSPRYYNTSSTYCPPTPRPRPVHYQTYSHSSSYYGGGSYSSGYHHVSTPNYYYSSCY